MSFAYYNACWGSSSCRVPPPSLFATAIKTFIKLMLWSRYTATRCSSVSNSSGPDTGIKLEQIFLMALIYIVSVDLNIVKFRKFKSGKYGSRARQKCGQ
jgi:hypothetical protein